MDVSTDRLNITVGGMTCAACVSHVEKALINVDGVTNATVNLALERATVDYLSNVTTISSLRHSIENSGYSFYGTSQDTYNELETAKELSLLKIRFIFSLMVATSIMATSILSYDNNTLFMILATPIQFWAGAPIFSRALSALKHRMTNMNTLITIGTFTAYFYSVTITIIHDYTDIAVSSETYFETSSAIVGIVLLGRHIESKSKAKVSDAIKSLMSLHPPTSRVIRNGLETIIPSEDTVLGDMIRLKPSEKIPVDGNVIEGSSWVDESMLTGESSPIEKIAGSKVYAATLNTTGTMIIEATGTGRETVLSRIADLIEDAQGSKAPIQRLADTISRYFIPVVLAISVITLICWVILGPSPIYAILTAVSVLVIACPCALGLATPTAIMVGTGKGAKLGILISNGEILETLHNVDTVVFDKTGTLTEGSPKVTDIIPNGIDSNHLLKLAASVEQRSEHPVADAIVDAALEASIELSDVNGFASTPGRGVRGYVDGLHISVNRINYIDGKDSSVSHLLTKSRELSLKRKTVVEVTCDGKSKGLIAVSDPIRRSSKETINTLDKMHIETVMLTGDNTATAAAVASELSIKNTIAEVLPEEKVKQIVSLQQKGKKIAMVGDGINDAAALAQADVGIAMGTGTDIAIEYSDITLLSTNLTKLIDVISLSKNTMRTIRQNIFWAFLYNVILIPVAAGILYPFFSTNGVPLPLRPFLGEFGLLNPILAATAMALSSIAVISNSLRLKRF